MKTLIRSFFILCMFLLLIGSIQCIAGGPFSRSNKNELNIFVYSDFLDTEIVNSFEKETGINVHLHYYSTNEELLAKLNLSSNKSYDLLFLADYASNILAKQGDLQEIDRSKIPVHESLYPFLLDKKFDPGNRYTIPYMWECSGIAYDNRLINEKDVSLDLLFDSPYQKVTTGDPIETINLAAMHLFGDRGTLNDEDQKKLCKCLKEQAKRVEAFAEFRAKDLVVGGNVPLALIKTPFIKDLKKENPKISFAFPKEAIFTSVESVVLLKRAQNVDNAYQFLRYIYQPENLAKTVERFPCFPASPKAFDYLEEDKDFLGVIDRVKKREKDMRFFYYILEKEKAHELYIEAKS